MTRLITAAALLLAGCAKSTVDATTPNQAKPSAPVEISADMGTDAATIGLVFRNAGSEVSVAVWGAGGLSVAVEPLKLGDVAAGETHSIAIPFEGVGSLAVSVDGAFGGIDSSRVQSFTVGEPTPVQVPERMVDGVPVNGWDGSSTP
jgi:hypothetical protein